MQCRGTTARGQQCRNPAVSGAEFCRFHLNQESPPDRPAAISSVPAAPAAAGNSPDTSDPNAPAPDVSHQHGRLIYFAGLLLTLVATSVVCFFTPSQHRTLAWLFVLVSMVVGFGFIGKGVKGMWRGVLVDSRNKMSLSRLQLICWTLIVFSGLLVAAVYNVRLGSDTPLNIAVPGELWILMGLSTSAAVASPLILRSRASQRTSRAKIAMVADAIASETAQMQNIQVSDADILDRNNTSVVVRYRKPEYAKWADLFMGEEVGNAESIETGKLQLFFLTFVLIISYATAIYAMLREPGTVTSLPVVQEGMNVLLGISQTGYLATKSMTNTSPSNPEESFPAQAI